jgi:UDPglucose 6-dehydrogenase
MKVAVIGTGYVGLVSGTCLAAKGHDVICVDLDPAKVDMINAGKPPIHERDLESMLRRVVPGKLAATTDIARAIADADISLIAVGTPFDGDLIDLQYVRAAARQVGAALKLKSQYHVVVIKSTVVPGTTEDAILPILEATSGRKAGADFGVGMNPEFLREGEAIADFMFPDRIVLGGIDARTIDVMAKLYGGFEDVEIVRTTPRTAEMIKYAANSLLATLISFSNEIGNLAADLGVDAVDVMRGVHLDKRLTPILGSGERVVPGLVSYLAAGCGFGGSCFPKDVNALIAHGQGKGAGMPLLRAVMSVNSAQPARMIDMLRERFPDLSGLKVAVLGLAFKPGTDDIRESPSLHVTRALLDAGAIVTAFDPLARDAAERVLPATVTFVNDLVDAVAGVDAVLLMTAWPEFKVLPAVIAASDNPPLLVDGRRLIDKTAVPHYAGIGL